ncbi:MAG: alpha/beta fold hydrolase [Myxococcales bacterium]|nr:alpha/beta fold hydrolase [Myxococcales bacterium]
MNHSEEISFPATAGHRLVGRLHRTAAPPRAFALFAHCFTCGKDLRSARRISDALASRGIATLRFDFTGLGESQGDFVDSTFSSNIDDLVAAAHYLRDHHEAPSILVGHSLGGAAVLAAAPQIPSAVAVATIGAPMHPVHIAEMLQGSVEELEREGEAQVSIACRSFRISRKFLDDLENHCGPDNVKQLKRALLIFHSPTDNVVGVENAKKLFKSARHPKSFVSLDGSDHILSRGEDAEFVGHVLAAWAERDLPVHASQGDHRDKSAVFVRSGGNLRQEILAHGHPLVADEPLSVGGTDEGSDPYGLLLASLGACTSMTLRLYADRKEWPLRGVEVELRHQKIHASDCHDCETKVGKVDEIERVIRLSGDLDEEQRNRLLEIANKCPVHRTLHGEIKVRSRLDPR